MRVDVHAHYNTREYFSELDRIGAIKDMPSLQILGHLWLPSADESASAPAARAQPSGAEALAKRVAHMDEANVDVQVLSIGAGQPYVSSEGDGVNLATMLNDSYADVIEQYPTRFQAFGCLPMPHVDASVREVERVFDELKFKGIALGSSAHGVPIDDERFHPIWQAIDDRGGVVYIHPGVAMHGVAGCLDFHLGPDYVSPAEMAVCASRLLATHHLDKFPNIKVIFATLGGLVPFLARRFDRGLLQDAPEVHASLGGDVVPHFRRFWYDTSVTEEPEALRAAVETYGADRLVLGTDFARPDQSSVEAVEYITSSQYLTEDEKKHVLDIAGARLLGYPTG